MTEEQAPYEATTDSDEPLYMYFHTQDPKYDFRVDLALKDKSKQSTGCLVNAETREPIPADEPIFIMRAKDMLAANALSNYCASALIHTTREFAGIVNVRVHEFVKFSVDHPKRMTLPD